MSLLIAKYSQAHQGKFYLAFMDLSAAFDCVAHHHLWRIMRDMEIDESIILFIRQLYSEAVACVCYGNQGECTRWFPINRGVRQGCVLAPFLSSLYTNGVEAPLLDSTPDVPKMNKVCILILLYADYVVLIVCSGLVLQKHLDTYVNFMHNLDLQTNDTKSFILVTGLKANNSPWCYIAGWNVAQTDTFSYLGVKFDSALSWSCMVRNRSLML